MTDFLIYEIIGMRFDLAKEQKDPQDRIQIEEYEEELAKLSEEDLQAKYQRARLAEMHFGKPEHAMSQEELREKASYEQDYLSELSASELSARYQSALEEEVTKLVETHQFHALTPELRNSYFGEPPDFARWSALDCWTADEAALLTLGLNPKVDLFSEIRQVRTSSSTAEEARESVIRARVEWEKAKAKVELPPREPRSVSLRDYATANAAAEYSQLRDKISRAINVGKLRELIIPSAYIIWAGETGISVPDELKRAVETYYEIPNWKARYDDLSGQYEALASERDDLKRQLELRSKGSQDGVTPKERASLKRLIIGMAIGGYGHDPAKGRSDTTKQISDDLLKIGLGLDEDTIRKWLQKSAALLAQDWNSQNSK